MCKEISSVGCGQFKLQASVSAKYHTRGVVEALLNSTSLKYPMQMGFLVSNKIGIVLNGTI